MIENLRQKIQQHYKKLVLVFFALLFTIGCFSFNDYGVSWDEPLDNRILCTHVSYMAKTLLPKNVYAKHINQFNTFPNLETFPDRDHGQAVFYPIAIFALSQPEGEIFNDTVVALRHFYNFLICFLALLCLYLMIQKLTKDWKFGILAVLFAFLSPRFFANFFYNCMDLIAFAMTIILMYITVLFFKKETVGRAIWVGVAGAFAMNTRLSTVLFLALALLYYIARKLTQKKITLRTWLETIKLMKKTDRATFVFSSFRPAILILTSIGALLLSYYIITPAMWKHPVPFLSYIIKQAAYFTGWGGNILYGGAIYNPRNPLPWHYLPVSLAITTPVLIMVLAIIGYGKVVYDICTQRTRIFKTNNGIFALIGFFSLLSLIMPIVLKSNVFNSWRHLYYIYSGILAMAVLGGWFLLRQKKQILTYITTACLISYVCTTSYWMVANHPYQYTYYNFFAGIDIQHTYETDYWCLSSSNIIRQLAETSGASKIYLLHAGLQYSGNNNKRNLEYLLRPEDRERVSIIRESELKQLYAAHKLDYAPVYLLISSTYESIQTHLNQPLIVGADSQHYDTLSLTCEVQIDQAPIVQIYQLLPANIRYMATRP